MVIEGVGAEYEYPKKLLALCVFHRLSAVFMTAIGHGCVMDCENMRHALWQSLQNLLYSSGCFEPNRKLLVLGPHRPCGSIAKGRKIMSCFRRSPMTLPPMIVVAVLFVFCLVFHLYFLHSNFWICLSASAVMEEIAISEKLSESVVALCVMVLSAPMVEYGHGV